MKKVKKINKERKKLLPFFFVIAAQ